MKELRLPSLVIVTVSGMFRLPKSSNQSPPKKGVSTFFKNQGLCKYPHRTCVLPTLESYDYCLKHILEDKSAPYKPCPYLYTVSGQKCGKAAYRPDRRDTWWVELITKLYDPWNM